MLRVLCEETVTPEEPFRGVDVKPIRAYRVKTEGGKYHIIVTDEGPEMIRAKYEEAEAPHLKK